MEKYAAEKFEVAVIGAGPAGMMAAIKAAETGARVVLVEKNERPGVKLLITGKGRCNICQAEFNLSRLAKEYGKNGGFLVAPFSVFGPRETIDFFENKGVRIKVERGGRAFPLSDRAEDVLWALEKSLEKNKVEIFYNTEVVDWRKRGKKITKIITKRGEIVADNYILCTGGKSYPVTGSTGDGYNWLKSLGHKVVEPRPALVPIRIKESWPKDCQGLGLKNVEIGVYQNGRKKDFRFGEALFTHFGLSGPIVLDMSKKIGELLKTGEVKLALDLKPALDFETLDSRLQRDFEKYVNKMFKNSLEDLLPQTLIPVFIGLSGINPDREVNQITREERHGLVKLLKGMEMTVAGLLGYESAIVTSGGVSLAEVDNKTMKSKLIDNLYFAGEILDLDGPSGGYNLQVCWTTGQIAGAGAVRIINRKG